MSTYPKYIVVPGMNWKLRLSDHRHANMTMRTDPDRAEFWCVVNPDETVGTYLLRADRYHTEEEAYAALVAKRMGVDG